MPATDRLRSALASQYSIEREIGAGGMATVYLARDTKHDREVALKVLRADLSAVLGTERFLSEVKIAAQLDHPHILTLIDSGEADGILYYVMPYVRGESLRSKLARERQLPVDEALSITRQVASALDYAHGKGVVHRDIKPENILLHEGEAVLADFGIALAVREASGSRMTETGLSLGTPQYMSPEQATGDRSIDKRSDIYSLAAVFYEMIAGEPPVSGVTAQAVIAKLMTEKPTRLRVLRDSISMEMDNATAKALAKVPADRFASAGEYARALAVAPAAARPARFTSRAIVTTGAVLALAIAGLWVGLSQRGDSAGPVAVLRDRTQVTFTGRVEAPTITPDGKTLAYIVRNCGTSGCRYGVEMQDVGASSSRRIFDGATAIYGIKLSADRRNLLLFGTINGEYGSFIVPTLAGAPRYLGGGSAAFWAGGDSLVFSRATPPGDEFWVLLSGLDGNPRDSLRIAGPALGLGNILPVPGTGWFLVTLSRDGDGRSEITAVDRGGEKRGKTLTLTSAALTGASTDAAWAHGRSPGANSSTSIIRFPFNSKTGAFEGRMDTVHSGAFTGFDIADDGSRIVIGEGTNEYTLWALPLADALKGRFTDETRIFRTTSEIEIRTARDGTYLMVAKATTATRDGSEWTLIPFGTRTETPIAGRHLDVVGLDSLTLQFLDRTATGVQISKMNRRTGARTAVYALADSTWVGMAALPDDGWAWIRPPGREINVHRRGQAAPQKFAVPPWFVAAFNVSTSRDGSKLAFTGWNKSYDSVGFAVMSLPDGRVTQVATLAGEGGSAFWLHDGTLFITLLDTPESATLYRMVVPGPLTRFGSVPRPLVKFGMSRDLRRFVGVSRERQGDAWVSSVTKR